MRALIFDFDGLILDTESASFQAWEKTYAEYGCSLAFETWAQWVGSRSNRPYEEMALQLGRAVDPLEVRARQREYALLMIQREVVMPGVVEYIQAAKRLGLKLAVASSSGCEWVTSHLERLGLLAHFDSIRCADDVEAAKPDPALYLLTLEALGIQPHEALALEDSPNGVLAARRAGIFCVAVPNAMTRTLNFDHASYRLNSLADLPLTELLALAARLNNGGPFS